MKSYLEHYEIVEEMISVGKKKAGKKWHQTILFAFLAGMFIALGAQASVFASHGISDTGVAKTVAGTVFPIGLIFILIIGGELFTGNCLLIMAVMDKKIKGKQMVKNLCLVFLGNLLGSLFIVLLNAGSGQFNTSHGLLAAYTIKTAVTKTHITPVAGLLSGILCNILVCFCVLLATCAKDVTGKILAVFIPIYVFVISGFEHCVANMYYLFAGIMAAKNPEYVALAVEKYGLSQEKIDSLTVASTMNNFIPVTLGNIIGGVVVVGMLYYYLNKKKKDDSCYLASLGEE